MVEAQAVLEKGVGMIGSPSAWTVPLIFHITNQSLSLDGVKLVAQPAVARQGVTAATAAPRQSSEAAVAAAHLVARQPHLAEAGVAAADFDPDAWLQKNYRVPPAAFADALSHMADHCLSAPASPTCEILVFTESLMKKCGHVYKPRIKLTLTD